MVPSCSIFPHGHVCCKLSTPLRCFPPSKMKDLMNSKSLPFIRSSLCLPSTIPSPAIAAHLCLCSMHSSESRLCVLYYLSFCPLLHVASEFYYFPDWKPLRWFPTAFRIKSKLFIIALSHHDLAALSSSSYSSVILHLPHLS